jgi:hypothetical protein
MRTHGANRNKEQCFNILELGIFKLADRTAIPPELLHQLKRDEWKTVHVVKLIGLF